MIDRLKKFFDIIIREGRIILKEDGFFFVVLTILNSPIIFYVADFQTGALKFWFGALAIFLVTAASHFLFLKLRRVIQTALIILFAAHFVTDIFLIKNFGVPLNLDTLQILLGTNPLTAKAFLQDYVLNLKILAAIAAFIIFTTALIFGLKKFLATRSEERLKRLTIDLLIIFFPPILIQCFIIFNVLLTSTINLFFNTTWGISINDFQYILTRHPIGSEEKFFAEMDKQLESEKILADKSDIPNVVFVLGESTDRNHMQLYNYRLPTTPRLTARFERGEIFRFNDTIACANNTSSAMAKIFTFSEKYEYKDDWYLKANLFDILNRAGYYTIWLSNQSPIGVFGNFDKYFSVRCNEKFFIESEDKLARQRQVDGVLLPVLDEYLNHSQEKNFWLIHLYGTHASYSERYPSDFEKFSATDIDKPYEHWRKVTAEYDNAVLYNDFIVDEIIRRFEDKNAVLIYISDHGDEVFEGRDFFGHSYEELGNVHAIEIPALVWASKEFRERYPEKISAIEAAVDRPYRTDYLIHAVLDLGTVGKLKMNNRRSEQNEILKAMS